MQTQKMEKPNLPKLSQTAFLSGGIPNKEKLFSDWKNGIIINVFENGTFNDMIELLAYYGRNKVIKSLKSAGTLRKTTINLCCSIFNLLPQDFKCFREKRFRPF